MDKVVMDMLQEAARDGSFISVSLKSNGVPFDHGWVAAITEDELCFKDGRSVKLNRISGAAKLCG